MKKRRWVGPVTCEQLQLAIDPTIGPHGWQYTMPSGKTIYIGTEHIYSDDDKFPMDEIAQLLGKRRIHQCMHH